jgi:hypothetical protein
VRVKAQSHELGSQSPPPVVVRWNGIAVVPTAVLARARLRIGVASGVARDTVTSSTGAFGVQSRVWQQYFLPSGAPPLNYQTAEWLRELPEAAGRPIGLVVEDIQDRYGFFGGFKLNVMYTPDMAEDGPNRGFGFVRSMPQFVARIDLWDGLSDLDWLRSRQVAGPPNYCAPAEADSLSLYVKWHEGASQNSAVQSHTDVTRNFMASQNYRQSLFEPMVVRDTSRAGIQERIRMRVDTDFLEPLRAVNDALHPAPGAPRPCKFR